MFIAKIFQSPKHTRWRRDEVQFVEIHKRAASCLARTHQCNRADLLASAETRRLLWLDVAKHAAAQRCDRASMLAGNEKHECRIRFESTLIARSPLPWSSDHTEKQRPKAHAAKLSKKKNNCTFERGFGTQTIPSVQMAGQRIRQYLPTSLQASYHKERGRAATVMKKSENHVASCLAKQGSATRQWNRASITRCSQGAVAV